MICDSAPVGLPRFLLPPRQQSYIPLLKLPLLGWQKPAAVFQMPDNVTDSLGRNAYFLRVAGDSFQHLIGFPHGQIPVEQFDGWYAL